MRDEHVLRAHVAVHDMQARAVVVRKIVRVLQTLKHLTQDVDVQLERDAVIDQGRERLPIQVLHRKEVATTCFAGFEGLQHIRMVQASGQLRLIHEHAERALSPRQIMTELFHDQQLAKRAQAAGKREVHRAHATLAELRDQTVLAQLLLVRCEIYAELGLLHEST
jgi:hypothetical protein